MSTTVLTSATPKPRAPPAATDVLPTDLARAWSHAHPALVLAVYAARFNAVVADPVRGLVETLIPLALLQIVYVCVCLPPAGSRKVQDKAGRKGKEAGPGKGQVVPAILSLILATTFATPLLYAILVLFGAPLTTHHAHTLLAAAHVALLGTLPLVYIHGVDGAAWRAVVALRSPIDEVYAGLLGACIGAWLGAIPIPLDWDRAWQAWPITIVTGAYGGWAVGKVLGGVPGVKGREIVFE